MLRLRAGVHQILAGGDLRGKPALIVTGCNDTILALNHASRAYYGLNRTVDWKVLQ